MVELLLQRGAEINQRNSDGDTALMTAAEEGHGRVVDLLIRHGAEVNLQSSNGGNALEVAGLTNGAEYRFSVVALNRHGRSLESSPCPTITVDVALPKGWAECHDADGRKYYANHKTRQSSWVRPEADDWFLPTELVMKFIPEEVAALRTQVAALTNMLQQGVRIDMDEILVASSDAEEGSSLQVRCDGGGWHWRFVRE